MLNLSDLQYNVNQSIKMMIVAKNLMDHIDDDEFDKIYEESLVKIREIKESRIPYE